MELNEETLAPNSHLEGPYLFGRCVRVGTFLKDKAKRGLDVLIVIQALFVLMLLILPEYIEPIGPFFILAISLLIFATKVTEICKPERYVSKSQIENGAIGGRYWIFALGMMLVLAGYVWAVFKFYSV